MSNSFLHLLFYLPVPTFELRVETSTSLLEEIRQLTEFLPRYAEILQGLFLPTWLFVAYLSTLRLSVLILSVKIWPVLAEKVRFFRFGLETRFHETPQNLLAALHARVQHISATVFYALL